MGDASDSDRSRAATAWLVLGTIQAIMATAIALWMLANGKLLVGSMVLMVALGVVVAVRWKRTRLKAPR